MNILFLEIHLSRLLHLKMRFLPFVKLILKNALIFSNKVIFHCTEESLGWTEKKRINPKPIYDLSFRVDGVLS